MASTKPTVAVIGGGIFGVTAALELAKSFDITLLERHSELLTAATYANHNRHHYGYHYPRSPETIRQCLESRSDFEIAFGPCLDWKFDNYYCVAKKGSKTSAEDYVRMCNRFGLKYEKKSPGAGIINTSAIAVCLKVKEAVYDIANLRALVKRDLKKKKNITVLLDHEVKGGSVLSDGRKVLHVASVGKREDMMFDFVVNATYARTNLFNEWFGFPKRLCQFNLQELDVVELPLKKRIGLTVQDGPFPSIIPLANSNRYLMAHVIESQLVREISPGTAPLLERSSYVESNWQKVQAACAEYLPILKKARYIKSIFVDRVVDADRLKDDSRVTELTHHGHGCWSVFSAKVITCVSTAKKLHALVQDEATA